MYTPNAAYSSTDTTSIHHAMYEKNRVRNAVAKPKITKPSASTFWPLPLLAGKVLSRIGRNRMVTAGIRNRYCHAMELNIPAANTPMDADS